MMAVFFIYRLLRNFDALSKEQWASSDQTERADVSREPLAQKNDVADRNATAVCVMYE